MNKKITLVGAFVLASMSLLAQENDSIKKLEEVVISDSKFALAKEKSGKVIVKITSEELQKRSGQSVAAILNSVVGLEINGNQSGAGKNLGIYMRGGRSRQTLILIDGAPVNDASAINSEYDLRLLPAEQIESIEIMKGASSTLYGSGAATGVINITLKKASKKKAQGTVYMNFGTQETVKKENDYDLNEINQGLNLSGTLVKELDYSTTINHSYVTGMSELKGDGYEQDSFNRFNLAQKIGIKPTDKLTFDLLLNYDWYENNFDGNFDNSNSADVKENIAVSEQLRAGFSPKYKYNKGELVLNAFYTNIKKSLDIYDSWGDKVDPYSYEGRSLNLDLFNKYNLNDEVSFVFGTQFQFHDMNANGPYDSIETDKAKLNILDPYLNLIYNSKFGLNINAGVRYTKHSLYKDHFVYSFNPSFNVGDTGLKLLASVSGAYITPSLYQLYSPYGNLELEPETNGTVEGGFDWNLLNKKVNFNAVAFYREENNNIGFVNSKYGNIEDLVISKGVETMLTVTPISKLKLSGNYTYTQNENSFTRLIPKHKANASVDYQILNALFLNINYQYTDKRKDSYFDINDFATKNVVLDSYKIVNATTRVEVSKNRLILFATASNIFNEDFIEIVGYNTRGRNFKVGFNFLF